MSTFLSLWTVLVLILFLAIVAWAWSGKNRKTFEAAARIPLDDEEPAAGQLPGETDNG